MNTRAGVCFDTDPRTAKQEEAAKVTAHATTHIAGHKPALQLFFVVKYIQLASELAQNARTKGEKFPLVRVVKFVIPPGGWSAPINTSGFQTLPLDTLGYYVLLLRHHNRFRVWNAEHLGVAYLTTNRLRRHRQILKDTGLLFQVSVRGKTYTTVLRSPLEPELRATYQRIYDDACHTLPDGPELANHIFAELVGCPDGPSLILPRATLVELIRLKVDLKAVGLWTALASQPSRHNWQNVKTIAQVLGHDRNTIAKHLKALQSLGLVKCVDKREVFVNMLINNELY